MQVIMTLGNRDLPDREKTLFLCSKKTPIELYEYVFPMDGQPDGKGLHRLLQLHGHGGRGAESPPCCKGAYCPVRYEPLLRTSTTSR